MLCFSVVRPKRLFLSIPCRPLRVGRGRFVTAPCTPARQRLRLWAPLTHLGRAGHNPFGALPVPAVREGSPAGLREPPRSLRSLRGLPPRPATAIDALAAPIKLFQVSITPYHVAASAGQRYCSLDGHNTTMNVCRRLETWRAPTPTRLPSVSHADENEPKNTHILHKFIPPCSIGITFPRKLCRPRHGVEGDPAVNEVSEDGSRSPEADLFGLEGQKSRAGISPCPRPRRAQAGPKGCNPLVRGSPGGGRIAAPWPSGADKVKLNEKIASVAEPKTRHRAFSQKPFDLTVGPRGAGAGREGENKARRCNRQ